jgi:hypothetical protein
MRKGGSRGDAQGNWAKMPLINRGEREGSADAESRSKLPREQVSRVGENGGDSANGLIHNCLCLKWVNGRRDKARQIWGIVFCNGIVIE